jgi:hypothetical protein
MSKKENLPLRIAKLHNLFTHLGKPGRKLVSLLSMYSLYVIFTNGGLEALAVICHEYILQQVKERTEHVHHTASSSRAPRA